MERESLFQRIDIEDIEKLHYKKKKFARSKIIWKFAFKTKLNKMQDIDDNYSRNMIKNQFNILKASLVAYSILGMLVYKLFLKGVYYTGKFYLNMNDHSPYIKVPLVSYAVLFFAFKSFNNRIYNPEMYRLALEYSEKQGLSSLENKI